MNITSFTWGTSSFAAGRSGNLEDVRRSIHSNRSAELDVSTLSDTEDVIEMFEQHKLSTGKR